MKKIIYKNSDSRIQSPWVAEKFLTTTYLQIILQIYSYIQRKNELNTSRTLTRVSCR